MNAPTDILTTIGMTAATALSLGACGVAVKRVCCSAGWERTVERVLVILVTLMTAGVFVYRMAAVHQQWAPLQSHVDGLALLGAMLGVVMVYVQWTKRLPGLDLFALPALALVTLWGVCASWWTLRWFEVDSIWQTAHLLSVFTGTLCVTVAAAAGALWLYVDRQLRAKDHAPERLARLGRLADLESVEQAITWSASAGFVLLTLALATGTIVVTGGDNALGSGWWYSPKVVLAGVVWAIFALVMHVRFVPTFRGRRAAVLAIVGFVLLIAVLGIAQALPDAKAATGKLEVVPDPGRPQAAELICT
ncbi:MAG: hypothetical protein GC159_21710 [Phycisphaera sp.]|nr:hypothetical protein [Phycisphaera sp.]